MKLSGLALLCILFVTTANAKVFKWVDENGTTHFSDKPNTQNAKEVVLQETGIILHEQERTEQEPPAVQDYEQLELSENPGSYTAHDKPVYEINSITEDDYRVTSNVGKLGADVISISGRISSGPMCKSMTVTATASNENGLRASIKQQVSKATSHGSTIFAGNSKVSGSRDDLSFWKIDSVTIRCNDN